jgi:hypothetical protein
MDHIREVPEGATETIRTVRKEILQSLVTTFTNTEFKSRVNRFTRTAEAIANYVGKEYSKEIKLLVKNHQKENEPKEPVVPGKEEAKSPFMMKKDKGYDEHKGKIFVIVKGQFNKTHPGCEEQQSGEPKGPQFDRNK